MSTASISKIAIAAHGLSRHFGSGRSRVTAVDGVSLEVRPGELVMIAGPSGSGKTTLVSMLGCLLTPSAGEVWIEGAPVSFSDRASLARLRARRIGFVFQAFNLLEPLNTLDNVLLPAALAGREPKGARRRAHELLGQLGMGSRVGALPRTLSGGERQRVAIARALVNAPPIVIADEPTGNLDSRNGQEVLMILHDVVRDHGCAVIVVTHDPRVEEVADRILWIEDGRLRDRHEETHAWRRDPVCGMRVDEWTAPFTLRHEGGRYAFCSRRCLERFVDDPGPYVRRNGA